MSERGAPYMRWGRAAGVGGRRRARRRLLPPTEMPSGSEFEDLAAPQSEVPWWPDSQ